MKGTVTRMVKKSINVVSAGLATVLPRKQVLVLLHSEVGRRMTGIPEAHHSASRPCEGEAKATSQPSHCGAIWLLCPLTQLVRQAF